MKGEVDDEVRVAPLVTVLRGANIYMYFRRTRLECPTVDSCGSLVFQGSNGYPFKCHDISWLGKYDVIIS